MFYSLISLFLFLLNSRLIDSACWKDFYGREVANVIASCSDDYEKSGLLCYPKCKEGFNGVGPICWETCKEGYDDHGITCFKNTHIYYKGCCCTIFSLSCCNSCNQTYTDDGCTCRRNFEIYFKKSYTRTAGIPVGCTSQQEQSGILCYQKCSDQYYGVGPICWLSCKQSNSFDCGLFCAKDAEDCSTTNRLMLRPILATVWFYNNKCDFPIETTAATTVTSTKSSQQINAELSLVLKKKIMSDQATKVSYSTKRTSKKMNYSLIRHKT